MSLWCCYWSFAFFIVWEFRMCVRCIWSISSPPVPPLSLYHCSLPVSYISFLFSLGPWVCLMLSVQGHGTIYWNMDSLLGLTSLKKTGSPSPNDHQLPTSSQLETRLLEHLPTPCLDFCLAWPCVGIVNAVTAIVCSWVQLTYWFWRLLFHGSCLPPIAPTAFLPTLQSWPLSLGRKGSGIDISCRAEYTVVSSRLHADQLWVSVFLNDNICDNIITLKVWYP